MAAELPPDQPVPLADAEVARRIAEAARGGRAADRTPTLEQLLAAFGEREPTVEARRRVRSALAVAGVRAIPDVALAQPGTRVRLDAGGAPGRLRPLLLGVAALVIVLGGAALAAALTGGGGGKRASELPAGPTASATTGTATGTSTTATATTPPTATVTTPSATQTTTVGTVGTTTTTTPRTTSTTPKRTARPPAHPPKRRRSTVTVRFRPAEPTYLCVKDGNGRILFGGTLSSPRVVRARVVRMNVGLASTRVTVNGRPLPLRSSPAGWQVTRKSRTPLGAGARPEC